MNTTKEAEPADETPPAEPTEYRYAEVKRDKYDIALAGILAGSIVLITAIVCASIAIIRWIDITYGGTL